MIAKFTEFFKKLNPGQKKMLVFITIGCALTLLTTLSYFHSSLKNNKVATKESKGSIVSMDDGLLAKSQLLDAQKEAQASKNALEEMKKQEEEKKKQDAAALLQPPGTPLPQQPGTGAATVVPTAPPQPFQPQKSNTANAKMPAILQRNNNTPVATAVAPPPPLPRSSSKKMPEALPPVAMAREQMMSDSEIGGISLVSGSGDHQGNKADDKKKDEKRSVFLPISYMEATLLSGLDAPTNIEGKSNPVPVLIRVQAPAVLPNDVKANLRGCFVVADGKGNLGTERAELVLVSLSCLDRKGQAVIDQSITGYVVDGDGKAGLRGHVVTKMGAMIARTMVAGLFGGIGDAVTSANTTSSISPLGTLQTVNPENLAMVGVGKGISNAFKEIEHFYMELAHQTLPVIEIGAARPVTLVLTKGTTLEIKKIRKGDRL
jgi:conjugal transfer pilus assembly protein TraB